VLALGAIWLVRSQVPDVPARLRESGAAGTARSAVLHPELARLHAGIFVLHVVLYAMFVVVPPLLLRSGLELADHWQLYLPVVLLSFVVMIPPILYADRRNRPKPVLIGAVIVLALVEAAIGVVDGGMTVLALLLLAFFVAFNILEALLPSLVSRLAPAEGRGVAIGVYNTAQTLGVFCGGLLGGWVAKHYGSAAVFGACAALSAVWLVLAGRMRPLAVNAPSGAAL
jgi:predicted MFS family arabinose efflux permease